MECRAGSAGTLKPVGPLPALLALLATWSIGCESVLSVGSDCPGRRCQDPLEGDACLLADRRIELHTLGFLPNGPAAMGYCVPVAPPRGNDGLVDCTLLWRLPEGARCADFGFTRPMRFAGEAGEVCAVNQLAVFGGALADDGGSGWLFDDFSFAEPVDATRTLPPGSLIIAESCAQRVGFLGVMSPPQGTAVELHCDTALHLSGNGGDAIAVPVAPPLDRCAKPAPIADAVGEPCTPDVRPAEGFDGATRYLQVRSMDCQSNACLVDRLEPEDCGGDSACTMEDSLARIYCSCRCDAGDAAVGDVCQCPRGFSCEDVLGSGPDGVRGGYCLRARR